MKFCLFLLFSILILLTAPISKAQENGHDLAGVGGYIELDSWEPDDLGNNKALNQKSEGLVSPISLFSLSFIQLYQKRISTNSTINRCPFKISCSTFAYRSIADKGIFVGLLLFIDRYYYRENPSVPYSYPLYEKKDGILKLNDDYFLMAEKY